MGSLGPYVGAAWGYVGYGDLLEGITGTFKDFIHRLVETFSHTDVLRARAKLWPSTRVIRHDTS